MRYDLRAMAMRATPGRRKRAVTLRDIPPPAMLATDLFASYKPVLTVLNRYAERLNVEYARTMSSVQTDSADDLNSILASLSDELQRLVLTLTPSLQEWCLRVERWDRAKFIGAVLSATGVDLSVMIGPEDTRQSLEAALNWNVSLVRDVGDQARQRMANAVFSGLRARTPAREVAAQIREATGMSRRRSLGVASDQLSKLTSALADERRRSAGISTWEWVHSRKLHPRASHVARNGHIYSDDPADVGTVIDGKTVEAPPPTRPGEEPWCGCRSRSVLVFS